MENTNTPMLWRTLKIYPLSIMPINLVVKPAEAKTKKRYYELMGLDIMKKDSVYDSLIDASKKIIKPIKRLWYICRK